MQVVLDEYYSRFTNGFKTVEVAGSTVGEVVRTLLNTYPQLMVRMMDEDGKLARLSNFYLDGEVLTEAGEVQIEVTTQVLELKHDVPEGEDKGVWQIIGGALLIIVGAVLMVFGVEDWGLQSIYLGVGLIIGGLAGVIMDAFFTPDAPPQPNNIINDSAIYTFTGVSNTTASGTSTQIVYGKHRIGGQVLNLFTTTDATEMLTVQGTAYISYDYLSAQIGLCEGEIHKVSDILINGYPRKYYDGITTHEENADYLRVGTGTQSVMADFSQVRNTTTVSRKVVNASTTITALEDVGTVTYSPAYGVVINNEAVSGYYKYTWAEEY